MWVKHRNGCPRRHEAQLPHGGSQLAITWSPGPRSVTPSPDCDHLRPPPRDRENGTASTAAARRYGRTGQNGTRPPRPSLISTWPGPGPTTWTSVADVELGVTNRMEYRSAHCAPPISGEFSSDRSKVEQVTVTPRNPQSARFAQIHEGAELSGPRRRGIQQTREGEPLCPAEPWSTAGSAERAPGSLPAGSWMILRRSAENLPRSSQSPTLRMRSMRRRSGCGGSGPANRPSGSCSRRRPWRRLSARR